jgi:hypothetical protein
LFNGLCMPRPIRIDAVLDSAGKVGLLADKNGRIAGRISAELISEAKRRTGIRSDTELLQFALASVALEDNFAAAFSRLSGTVDADLDLEF